MPVGNMADRTITLYRRTAYVFDAAAAAASQAASRQPTGEAVCEVTLTGGTSSTGTVTIAGTVEGSADTETLTFTAAGVKRTVKRFTAITGITTTGLADEATPPTLSVRAVGRDGAPIHATTTVASDVPARRDSGPTSWPAPVQGSTAKEGTRFYTDWDTGWTPRPGDVILDGLTAEQFELVGVHEPGAGGARAPHHRELRCELRAGVLTA
jgi:hypothetical protein